MNYLVKNFLEKELDLREVIKKNSRSFTTRSKEDWMKYLEELSGVIYLILFWTRIFCFLCGSCVCTLYVCMRLYVRVFLRCVCVYMSVYVCMCVCCDVCVCVWV